MSFEILTTPTKVKHNKYVKVGVEVLELKDISIFSFLFWCIVSIPLLLYFLWQVLYNYQFAFLYKIPLIQVLFIFIFCVLSVIFRSKNKLTFERKKGTVFFQYLRRKKNLPVDFNNIEFVVKDYNLQLVNYKNNSNKSDISIGAKPIKDKSLLIWYMDRNRPLPPGTAFDEFRDIDFKRRQEEGFPSPLYKSRIPTPEASPEQQAEREKFWKDIDYLVP
jgi:hypothetical protein